MNFNANYLFDRLEMKYPIQKPYQNGKKLLDRVYFPENKLRNIQILIQGFFFLISLK